MKQELDSPLGGSSTPLVCPFCGRNDFKRKESLTLHIKYCKSNPDRVEHPQIGKKHTEETKQKISEASKKQWEDPTNRQKMIESIKIACEDPNLRQKRSETSKRMWQDPEYKQKMCEANYMRWEDPEYKQKMCETQKKRCEDPEVRQKMSENNRVRWQDPEYKQKMCESLNNPDVKQKRYDTMKQNNSFNTSKIEEQLKEWFISQNIDFKTQYKSDLYPFMCDFYLPKYDLYIEIQGSWTHGGKPYNETDTDCIKQLENWKSKNSKFYDNAIETWTMRDVKKRDTAKANNLNWIEIFSCDLEECINIIQKHIKC